MSAESTSAPTGLSEQVKAGVVWTVGARFAAQGIAFFTTAILAHRIAPSAYGLVGMAQLILGLVGMLRDLGLGTAIVQKRDISPVAVATLFWLSAGSGLFATGLCCIGSPIAARFFRQPSVAPILIVMSASLVIGNIGSIPSALIQRAMAFRSLALIDLLCGAGSLLLALVLVRLFPATAWTLVAVSVGLTVFNTTTSFLFARYVPILRFSWREARGLVRFGAYLSGSTIITYFTRNSDNILIGRYLGPTPLSYYQFAYNLMLYPLYMVSHVLSRVMFPALCVVQDQNDYVRRAYLRMCACISLITFPMMAGLWVVRREFTLVVLGPKWLSVAPLIGILAPIGLMQSILVTVGMIYMSKGKSDQLFRWSTTFGVLYIASFIVGLRWGVEGVASCYAIACLLLTIPTIQIPARLIDMKISELAKTLLPQFLVSCGMILTVWMVRSLCLGLHFAPLSTLVLCVSSGVFVYGSVMLILRPPSVQYVLNLLSTRRKQNAAAIAHPVAHEEVA